MTLKQRRHRIAFTRSAFLFAFFLFVLISAAFSLPVLEAEIRGTSIDDINEFDGTFPDWYIGLDSKTDSDDYITYTQYRTSYCTFASTTTQCDVTDDPLIIRFDTAEELYRWSIDVSMTHYYASETQKFTEAQVAVILNQDYALGNNIDYSTMASKTFSPIGYSFNDAEEVSHSNYFTGTFDGRGFVISNLYVAGYDYMVYPDENEGVAIDIALSNYYSMFLINGGEIHDFGLINPTLEMLNLHIDITKVSNLVGDNLASGIVDHVFVIDTRTSVTEAGIRYKVGTSSGTYSGAGVVHTNQGVFTNAYYSSILVINGSYFNKFTAQPVLYTNTGTYGHLAYDSTVYLYPTVTVGSSTFTVTPPNALATGETTTVIKSGTGSVLNHDTDRWHFFASDCYPLTQGLDWDTDHYLISNAVDLAFFSRVLAFSTQNNGVSYASANYHLTNDIDMSTVAPGTYVTPSVNFSGTLSGDNPNYTDEQGYNYNYYIHNLTFTTGTIRSTAYYTGLFSIISGGTVDRLNLNDFTIALADTETYYSYTFYVGAIAGRIISGTVSNVLVNASIDLGSTSLGTTNLGGIVGVASGTISQTAFSGTLVGGTHTYNASYAIAPLYNFGGIVGAASSTVQLTLSSVRNNATITGLSTSSTLTLASGSTQFMMRLGGIVGYIPNSASIRHRLVNVANFAGITCGVVTDPASGYDAYQHVGGVFGELSGSAPVLETGGNYVFANLYNSGNVTHSYSAGTATVRSAGIGVSNTTEAVEYALLFNHGSFAFSNPPTTNNGIFRYTGTIYDIGTSAVTISRAYNFGNRTYSSSYYSTSINPFYYSANNRDTLLRYCANYGDIYFWNNSGATQITLTGNLVISGITSCTNVSYLNVANYGDITLVNVTTGTSYTISVAGIGSTLTSGKYMKNALNEGIITVATIAGTANLTYGYSNIYLGGLVNYNYSGDLQNQDASSQPVATLGVINSVNEGDITTTYSGTYYGITGTGNTYAAGIATLTSGSIQDCANFGAIRLYNSNTGGAFTFSTDTAYAGRIDTFSAGLSAGGIAGVVLSATSRIYDSANNGEIVAKASKYARAGGVLSTCLYSEAGAGGIKAALGLANTIENSILSNGLNFGNIVALTNTIGTYTTSSSATNTAIYYGDSLTGSNRYFYATVGTADRPPVYSSAGGVIGYGLCVMRRMLNHGTIAAMDVAGGIVGATYVLGATSGNVTTVVNINTAINYGNIKSIATSSYASISSTALTYSNASGYFQADGNTFIFPTGYTVETPAAKRGFGGVFGRLQRGTNGYMTSSGGAFDFIVNANPAIDLIGRLDQVQNWTSSSRFFQFNNAIYYSAKTNDTTQAVFTGFYYCVGTVQGRTGSAPYIYTVNANSTQYLQVGLTSTAAGTYASTFTFPSSSSYSNGTTVRMYRTRAPLPWITEDPNQTLNDDTEYMYDPDFPMRSNSALTEYIYYMTYDLLASRFQTGGTNPRPNGMYVLSTTAGSTFGSVLPANLNLDAIRPFNEDYLEAADPPAQISLLGDYTAVSPIYLADLSTAVTDDYDALRQTIFNDKSALLEDPGAPVTLTEVGGSGTVLSNPSVDYVNKTLTFSISMEAFLSGQTSVSYAVSYAETSAQALIAQRVSEYITEIPANDVYDYRAALHSEGADAVSVTYAPHLGLSSGNLPAKTITTSTTLSIGYFVVYSEAFVGDDLFVGAAYYTEYHVYVTFTPGAEYIPTGTLAITTVAFNGGGAVNITDITGNGSVVNDGDVNYNGSITFNFTDTKGVLTEGQDLKTYVRILLDDGTTVVGTSYYTLTSTPITISAGTGTGSVTVTFTNQTKMGNYRFYYKYFSSSTEYYVTFDKAASNVATVTDLDHYSESGSLSIGGTTITSAVNFGYPLTLGPNGTSGNFTSSTNGALPTYLDRTTYTVVYNSNYANTFAIAPFATITNAYLSSTTYSNGYKVYTIVYVITAENGTTSTTYTHTMTERTVNLDSVLKDGNEVALDDIHAQREVEETVFTVDLGLDQALDLYRIETSATLAYITSSVSYYDGTTTIDITADLATYDIIFTVGDYLILTMGYDADPGDYTFTFYLQRGNSGSYVTLATTLVITKDEGTNSHLTDIRFSDLANETDYPDIYIVNTSDVMQTTPYDPAVYFAGIDYDGADAIQNYHYHVDGSVSNTPLDDFLPYMIDYLPYGATIARYAYNAGTSTWYWTAEVTANATEAELAVLAADYTHDPVTGEDANVVVQYRVTSEDGNNYTYYFVTVTDVTYNVTLVFDIYYCTGAGEETCSLASESAGFSNRLVMLTVQNLVTDGDDTVINVTNPIDYPDFTVVTDLYNQVTQFYYTYSGDYRYSFGRNRSGFFSFSLLLPKDQYLNDLYEYEIKYGDYFLNPMSDYIAGMEGKYFYIEYSNKNRTRRFNVYIRDISSPATSHPWGLWDFFVSWWE